MLTQARTGNYWVCCDLCEETQSHDQSIPALLILQLRELGWSAWFDKESGAWLFNCPECLADLNDLPDDPPSGAGGQL